MRVWEQRLTVRRLACEFRLYNKRLAHSDWTEKRKKDPPGGISVEDWAFRCGQNLMRLQNDVRRELEEIRHIKILGLMGPLVGDAIAVSVPGSQQSVSMFDILERISEDYSDASKFVDSKSGYNMKWYGMALGIQAAIEIITNPREFMTTEEQESYDFAAKDMKDRESSAERFRTTVEPPKSYRAETAVKKPAATKKVKTPGVGSPKKTLQIINGKVVYK